MRRVSLLLGDDAIAVFKEGEFRVSLMFPSAEFKLASVHGDCEKSLIGPLCDLLKSRGIWPSNTPHEQGPEPFVLIAFCGMSQNVTKRRLTQPVVVLSPVVESENLK